MLESCYTQLSLIKVYESRQCYSLQPRIEKVIPFYRDVLGFTFDYQTERFVSFLFPMALSLVLKTKPKSAEVQGFKQFLLL